MPSDEYRAEDITRYVELEAEGETVRLAERVTDETVMSMRYEVWNVHTDTARYWVITHPTNLYLHDDFPSHDYALSFHIGLTMRMNERSHRTFELESDAEESRGAWRRFSWASEALANAREAEDFQAVGMRCREILLELPSELRTKSVIEVEADGLQDGNFIDWVDSTALKALPGSSNERIRRHLRDTSKTTWQMASWLTHYQGATYFLAEVALEATRYVVGLVTEIALRDRLEPQETCPACGSYQVEAFWLSISRPNSPGVVACAVCEWERPNERS